MPRLTAIDPAHATGKARELLDLVKSKIGLTPNMMRTMANSSAVLQGYLDFSGALQAGALAPRLREQIALAVGETNACDYCLAAHTTLGKMAGLREAEILASRELAAADPKERAALRFAAALLDGRGEVPDAEFARLRGAGFGEGEIAEIIAHVALNVFTNYFNKAARVVVDFPRIEPLVKQTA